MQQTSQNFLDKVKRHLGDENIQTVLKEGIFADIILETATELDADIIVLGSQSTKWMENVIMGSVTADVLQKTTIPLFIIPTKKRD